ncbi:MAG: hypothetical protein AABY74_10630, partial [Planctomycetota bacterium]
NAGLLLAPHCITQQALIIISIVFVWFWFYGTSIASCSVSMNYSLFIYFSVFSDTYGTSVFT